MVSSHVCLPSVNERLKSDHVLGRQKGDPTMSVYDKHHPLASDSAGHFLFLCLPITCSECWVEHSEPLLLLATEDL